MREMTVAVIGATGRVGREMVAVLGERGFPAARLRCFASAAGGARTIPYRGSALAVEPVADGWWRGLDVALFAAGDDVSRAEAPRAAADGVLVIDNSSAFRMDPGVPLVVSEVNPEDLSTHGGIVANPNCCTMQLVVALAPLELAARLARVVVSTYQSVSGAGIPAERALAEEIGAGLRDGAAQEDGTFRPRVIRAGESPFPHPIAWNVIPQVGSFGSDGWCGEETKIRNETRKILHRPDLAVAATVVRVPVVRGHAEAVTLDFERPLAAEEARDLLRRSPGLVVMDDPASGVYPTPLEAAGRDPVCVGRIRQDPDLPRTLHLWVVGDNVRKGAAANAVDLAELAVRARV